MGGRRSGLGLGHQKILAGREHIVDFELDLGLGLPVGWVDRVPKGLDGQSFGPVLTSQSKTARPELMLSYLNKQRAIRDDRWKLIRYPLVDVTQLFDLHDDPDETNNLADLPEHQPRVTNLLARLHKLQRHYADEAPLTVPNPQPAQWSPPH